MILFDPCFQKSLVDYGIMVPLKDERATKTIDKLLALPEFQAKKNEWLKGFDPSFKLTFEDILRVHTSDWTEALESNGGEGALMKAYELINEKGEYHRYTPKKGTRPLSELVQKIWRNAEGTLQSFHLALENQFCYFLGGGMHHAFTNEGRGFCLIHDAAIGVRKLQSEEKIKTAWIIDLDAHKGDGSAEIFRDDPTVRTFSIHMKKGWPLDGSFSKKHASFIPSDLDIEVCESEQRKYLTFLESGLDEFQKSYSRPDLAIVMGGSDPYEKDELPGTSFLRLTLEEMRSRDEMVIEFLKKHSIPQSWLITGGYGVHSWEAHYEGAKYGLSRFIG
jgi:acetoin utilization deacetylase AcuC-like enzyme